MSVRLQSGMAGRLLGLMLAVVMAVVCVSCVVAPPAASDPAFNAEVQAAEVIEHYADGVFALYSQSLSSATDMSAAIDGFLADPNPSTLEAAKRAWLVARDDYGLTEVFRFYEGPIDNEEDGPEGLLNA